MSADDLSARSRVSRATLSDFESGKRSPHPRTLAAIRAALEAAGVDFIAENGGGAGVRLKRPARAAIPVEDLNASNDE
jgi:transcriptional regulator with XRE-family HTH domain